MKRVHVEREVEQGGMAAAIDNHIDAVFTEGVIEDGHHGIVENYMRSICCHFHFKQLMVFGFHLDRQVLAVDVFVFYGVIGRLKDHVGKTEFQACLGIAVSEAPLLVGDPAHKIGIEIPAGRFDDEREGGQAHPINFQGQRSFQETFFVIMLDFDGDSFGLARIELATPSDGSVHFLKAGNAPHQ